MIKLQPLEIDPLTWAAESSRARRRWFTLSSVTALSLHVAGGMLLPRVASSTPSAPPPLTEVFEIEPPPEPKAPPPPVPDPEPSIAPPPTRTKAAVDRAPPAAAPPPAPEAAAVLTAPDEDAPLDLSNTFVTGTSTSYRSGLATSAPSVPSSRSRTQGTALGVAGSGVRESPDRSRSATLSGGASWNCPFPREADLGGINHAASLIRVVVGADGRASSVSILRDPGHGFGAAARACALRRRYTPALDRNGSPIATSLTLNVRFDR